MATVRVAAVQFAVGDDVPANLATCLRMVGEAAARGARLIVLPEFVNHLSWYDDRARRAGIDVDPILHEVAAMSSDVDRYGMGSTRTIILACTRAPGGAA